MKIITWNVNGIRSRIFTRKTSAQIAKSSEIFHDSLSPISNLLTNYDPDFLCFQETRCSVENGSKFKIPGYSSIFNESNGSGARDSNRYSGTCIFYKDIYKPLNIYFQIPNYNDIEGRIIIMEFENFIIINVYTPNSGTNFDKRLLWQSEMLKFLKILDKPVIYTGDMNVAWRDSDVHFRIKSSPTFKNVVESSIVGFLPEEREFIPMLLNEGFVDAYTIHEKNYEEFDGFTYWDSRSRKIEGLPGARYNKHGWRIDYHLTKKCKIIECYSLYNIGTEYIQFQESQCSDHCPVYVKLEI